LIGGDGGSRDSKGGEDDQAAELRCHGQRSILNHDAVQLWIDAYVNAWRTYDPAAIGALFAEDATYAYPPYDRGEEVVRSREAIVADWLEERVEPGTWEARYRRLVVEGQRAVAEGTTCFTNGDLFWNLWSLRFDDEGRCAEFVEWFMVRPQD
jgi:hypothetical protein